METTDNLATDFVKLIRDSKRDPFDCLLQFLYARYKVFYEKEPRLLCDASEITRGGSHRKTLNLNSDERLKQALEHYELPADTLAHETIIRDIEKLKFLFMFKLDEEFDFTKPNKITIYYDPEYPVTLTVCR